MSSSVASRFSNFFVNFFSFTGQLVPQQEAEQSIRDGVSFKGTNIVILILAILIASLGLNTNSTAVIIGAMLISPLMGPIIGMGLGVGIHDFGLIKRSFHNLAMATAISVITSTIYFVISPVTEGSSELLARTSPTIYDVFIGLFGGMAGVLAIGSRSKGNVIPGVAIATALMPPLCTAGYGIATLQLHYFLGAFYLFLINSIYIAFATTIGVKLMGYHDVAATNPQRALKVKRIVYALVIVTMIPSIYLTYTMVRENSFRRNVSRFVNTEFHFPGTQVLDYKANITNGQKLISVALIGKALPVDSVQLALTAQLPRYDLGGASLSIIQGDERANFDPTAASSTMLRDIYQVTQVTIDRQTATIDSLRTVNAERERTDSLAATISPELRVLFPQIKDIAITRGIVSDVATGALDTVGVALVQYNRPMDRATRQKFVDYLEARLKMPGISIVENTSRMAFPAIQKKTE